MGLTATEKILARAAGRREVVPGEIITAEIDSAMLIHVMSDITFPAFEGIATTVWDASKVVCVVEHCIPAHNVWAAETQRKQREFAKRHGLFLYDVGRSGICHQVMMEKGHTLPGTVVVGTDSDCCTYGALGCFATGIGATEMAAVLAQGKLWFRVPPAIKLVLEGTLPPGVVGKDVILHIIGQVGLDGALYKTVEFSGSAVQSMSLDSRMTVTNMVEMLGAKNGIVEPDEKTIRYLKARTDKPFWIAQSDPTANWESVIEFDISDLGPQVAAPNSPTNVSSVREVVGTRIHQAFIGGCTNGRMEDLRTAAQILAGRQVHSDARLIVIPASQEIYAQAMEEGILRVLLEAGAAICTPSCGPCVGIDKGVLASGEVCISSTNKNYRGRMGHSDSLVYLASAGTVAASAVKGEIADPRDFL
jgi:3-isopropylmalate/(R)-2-methylmalate dehydratase large subunit